MDWSGYSFASGDTIAATLLYGQLLLFLLPLLKTLHSRVLCIFSTASLVFVVGFSRIALGAHFLTDVLAAIFFGIIWLMLLRFFESPRTVASAVPATQCARNYSAELGWTDARAWALSWQPKRLPYNSESSLNPAAKSPECFQLLPMRGGKKIRIAFYLLAAGGAALFTFLLIRQGASHVIAAFASAGWWIAAVAIYHVAVPLLLDAVAWWALFPKSERLSLWQLFWMRWIGESVSTLVPSATVGGDVVRARLAALHGTPIPTAAASVLVDITLGVFVQIVFTLLGLGLIVSATGQQGFVRPTLIGAVIGVLAIVGFYIVQRLGVFRFIGTMISRLANAEDWHSMVHSGHTLDQAIRRLYARRSGVIGCCAATATSLLVGSGEIWIALHALGLHATLVNAVILQSMVLAIRSAVFPVPGALGVQEGAYVVVGNLLGIPGDAAFALSLIARVRELILGIPGLVAWQMIEARRVLRARLAASAR